VAARVVQMIVILALLVAGSGPRGVAGQTNRAATLAEAEAIWIQHDFRGAYEAFAQVAETTRGRQRAAALRWRGLLAWRHFGDHDFGAALFDEALAVGVERSETLRELSRLELDRGEFDGAWEAAASAVRSAETEGNRMAAIAQRARVANAQAEARVAASGKTSLAETELGRLREAYGPLAEAIRATSGDLDLARVGVRTALLLGDGSGLLEAWRSYYVLIVGQEDAGVLGGPRETLHRLLPAWSPAAVTPGALAEVVVALGESAFHREAWLAPRLETFSASAVFTGSSLESRAHEILAYAEFIESGRELTDAFYAATSEEKPDADEVAAFRSNFVELARPLWAAIAWGDAPFTLNESTLKQVLELRFGATLLTGETAGYEDIHWGHRVIDEQMEVSQYGYTAELGFTSLDGMVSNGFQSWAWDHRTGHGGWAVANAVTQVRTGYAGTARGVWRGIRDPVDLERFRRETDRETRDDWARAARDEFAYLPGLVKRLQLQGVEQLLAMLASRGVTDADPEQLEREFILALDATIFESSIVAHEGRHSIDKRINPRFSTPELEFRAKLSQVAFASYPRLALDGIFSGNIGDQTPHGQANLRVIQGLVEWMDAHQSEIEGFDVGRPTLPQFDRLTDEQMKAAFAAQDPLAR
jgi:hypothetical protein